jgi:hypothetical protein
MLLEDAWDGKSGTAQCYAFFNAAQTARQGYGEYRSCLNNVTLLNNAPGSIRVDRPVPIAPESSPLN